MDKKYRPQDHEQRIYQLWESSGAFTPQIDPDKKPYTIVLPPPNASGKMHIGNVLMIAIEDLLIRWKRMQGYNALWLPGTDHAGFETQIKYENKLKTQGKSRFDFDRQTLYQNIWDFVQNNKKLIEDQIRSMGASVDWTRYTFTLDPKVIDLVFNTFSKMHQEGYVYRDDYMVNYCPQCGTTFADLEIVHQTRQDPLYYIKYGPLIVATVRPETKFGDTALAIHPDDPRYQKYIGQEIEVQGLSEKFNLKVIADDMVDPEFGTGVVKITPAHDPNDFEAGKRHKLDIKSVIDLDGKLNELTGPYQGMTVSHARGVIAADLERENLIEKVDPNYTHSVAICYKAGHDIEPTILPNWFIKVADLKKPAHQVVKNRQVKIYPKWQETKYHRWMEIMHDWPISRQVVWGIRIPAWYSVKQNPHLMITFLNSQSKVESGSISDLLKNHPFSEIEAGLQTLIAPKDAKFTISKTKPGDDFLQETDTFDTWFSSGHWPLVTTGYPYSPDFKYFYPTDVLETGWEILRLWVSRMIMFGIYHTGQPPFRNVYLHGMVRAIDGRKMSKSLGNEIVPEDYQQQFGTDALRMGLIMGTANGKDFNFPHDKILAFRNFANKLWNIARFIELSFSKTPTPVPWYQDLSPELLTKEDQNIIDQLNKTIKITNKSLTDYKFALAAETIYHFAWDDLASNYLEAIKPRLRPKETKQTSSAQAGNKTNEDSRRAALSILRHTYFNILKLLHPFMPFVTEAIWQELKHLRKYPDQLLISSKWPSLKT